MKLEIRDGQFSSPDLDIAATVARTLKGTVESDPEFLPKKVVILEKSHYRAALTIDFPNSWIQFMLYGPEPTLNNKYTSLGRIVLHDVKNVLVFQEGMVAFIGNVESKPWILKVDSSCSFMFTPLNQLAEESMGFKMGVEASW